MSRYKLAKAKRISSRLKKSLTTMKRNMKSGLGLKTGLVPRKKTRPW